MELRVFFFILSFHVACMRGEYKSIQGNEDCVECPENSNSTQTGATSCDCVSGYYRASSENITVKCTGKLFRRTSTKYAVLSLEFVLVSSSSHRSKRY